MRQPLTVKTPGRNDPCWCGSEKKFKKCHMGQAGPAEPDSSLENARKVARRGGIVFKTPAQIEGIRKSCQLTKDILDLVEGKIQSGISTEDINTIVHEATLAAGAIPATLNYKGYTKSVCTSINDVVCHGIPTPEAVLADGDIINVDVTSVLDGYFGDASRMYKVGQVSKEAALLVEVTAQCLQKGIDQVRPGGFIGDIGQAIQTHAEKQGYSVVRDFVGHGVGLKFHEEPQVPHFGRAGTGEPLVPGMVFTIEPMINMGNWPVKILEDHWTAVTKDGSLSAQFEHTVLVTEKGVEVLTA